LRLLDATRGVPLAKVAEDLSLEGHLEGLAVVEVLECHLESLRNVFCLLFTAPPSPAPGEGPPREGEVTTTTCPFAQALLSETIIEATLLAVRQHFVGCAHLLELPCVAS
jgi:hypothetical protein